MFVFKYANRTWRKANELIYFCFYFYSFVCLFQWHIEKEQNQFELNNLQTQLDKALGQSARLQKDKDVIQTEYESLKAKYEISQVPDINIIF